MRLVSFIYRGKAYAMYIGDKVVLYTDKTCYLFKSHYEALDWIKLGTNGKYY